MVRSVLAVLMAIDLKTLEEGAASLGAGFRQRFFHIVLPNCRAGVLAGSLMVVTLSMGEFNMTWLLHTPLQQDAAGRPRRRLCLAAAGDRQRLHAGVLPDDRAAAARDAGPVAAARGEVPGGRGVTAIPDAAKPISITLERCAKTFADGTRALEPLDLTIDAGETVVFLGPSGCGKTTTLRIIAGLEAPDAGGRVLFDGTDVTPLPIEKRNVGMVFQSYALFPNMSVAEQHRLRPEDPQARRDAESRRARRRDAGHDAHRGAGGPQHRPALGRPAPARGAGARARRAAARPAARRAADGARRQAARYRCGSRSTSCCAASASPPSTSPTTRPRRWRWATASW